ncbi:MAG: FMN-binding glutamate synthase family protein [Firmicutes bacterium]|nr:FMN-binding glutamate synthase family protein [Bacillota bacterium]
MAPGPIGSMRLAWLALAAIPFATAALFGGLIVWGGRLLLKRVEASLGQPPQSTMTEMWWTAKAHPPGSLFLTMQRAESGLAAEHPLGSVPHPDWLSMLGWDVGTLARPPVSPDVPVDLTAVLGATAAAPVTLAMPVFVAPMGFGLGLSAEMKVALAQAATLAGTAIASGEGPYLPEERAYAARWILQESRGGWAHQAPVRRLADAIEIAWGQGSEGSAAIQKSPQEVAPRMREAAAGAPRLQAPAALSLEAWLDAVRRDNPRCPVGVKIPATHHLEEDLAALLRLGVDCVTLDGSGAGSAGSPAVISDHAGLSTALAAHRAHQWLTQAGVRARITLVVSGGVHGASDILALIALGADAVAVGTELLMAALHEQIAPHWPGTPPTALAFHRVDGKPVPRLDVDRAAEHVANWFEATRAELDGLLRALGLTSLAQVRELRPLVARTAEAALAFQLPYDAVPPFPDWGDRVKDLVASYRQMNQVLSQIYERWPRHGIS